VYPWFGPTVTQQHAINWSLGKDPFGLSQSCNYLSLKFFTCQFTVSNRLQPVLSLTFCQPTRAGRNFSASHLKRTGIIGSHLLLSPQSIAYAEELWRS
jgi:hypothetical protein